MHAILLMVHVLGATVWTGGHLVLALTVLPRALKRRDPDVIREFESGFEKLAIPALIAQVVTGMWLASGLFLGHGCWFALDDPRAPWVYAKLLLLASTVALALHARLRILPDLDERKLKALAYHIVPVTVLAVLLVVAGVAIGATATAPGS